MAVSFASWSAEVAVKPKSKLGLIFRNIMTFQEVVVIHVCAVRHPRSRVKQAIL